MVQCKICMSKGKKRQSMDKNEKKSKPKKNKEDFKVTRKECENKERKIKYIKRI